MAKKVELKVGLDTTEVQTDAAKMSNLTKKEFDKVADAAEKSSKEVTAAYRTMGIRTDKSIKDSTAKAKANYEKIKKSGTASAREIRLAHDAMTAKIKANNAAMRGGALTLGKVWTSIKTPLIALVAVGFAVKKAFDFAEAGAKLRVQKDAFDSLSESMEASGDEIIKSLKKVSKGTVTEADLIASAGKAMLLGLAPDKLVELLEIARAASKITGDSITKSFEDITTGVGRQSKLILDNLGIILDVGKANDKYAESLGKSSLQLTDNEKKLAVLLATAEAGRVIVEGVGEDTLTTADKIAQMKVAFTEAFNEMTIFVANIFDKVEPSLKDLGKSLQVAGGWVAWLAKTASTGFIGIGIGLTFLASKAAALTDALGLTSDAQLTLIKVGDSLRKTYDNINRSMDASGKQAERLVRKNRDLLSTTKDRIKAEEQAAVKLKEQKKEALKQLEEEKKTIEENLKVQLAAIDKRKTELTKANIAIRKSLKKTQDKIDDLKADIDKFEGFAESIEAAREEIGREKAIGAAGKPIGKIEIRLEFIKEDFDAALIELAKGTGEGADAFLRLAEKARDAALEIEAIEPKAEGITGQRGREALADVQVQAGGILDALKEASEKAAEIKAADLPGEEAKASKLEEDLAGRKRALDGLKDEINTAKEDAQKLKDKINEAVKSGTLQPILDELATAKEDAQTLKDKLNEDTSSTHTTTFREAQAKNEGGIIRPLHANRGLIVSGQGGVDKIPAMLTNKEGVVQEPSMRKLGDEAFHAFNAANVPALMGAL